MLEQHGPNTPGPGGYLAAWGISCGAMIGALGVLAFADAFTDPTASAWDALAAGVGWIDVGCVFVPYYSVPFAMVGIPVVHLVCRRVPWQWVHVLAAGLVGLLPVLALSALVGEWWGWWSPYTLVAPSAAFGRLAVVPFVWHGRNSARALATG